MVLERQFLLIILMYTQLMVCIAQVYRVEHHYLAQAVKQISHMGCWEHIKLSLPVKAMVVNAHPKFHSFFVNK